MTKSKTGALLNPEIWTHCVAASEWVLGSGVPLVVTEAATGTALGELGTVTSDQVLKAASQASAVQKAWAACTPSERAAVLRRAADIFERDFEEIVVWIVRESGSTWAKAKSEVMASIAECREAAALPTLPLGDTLATNKPRWSFSRSMPAGVVAVIAPFNYPLILAMRSVAPAVALGNAVLLKPDPRTSVCGGVVVQRVFEEAGLPGGVLQMLPGGADAGAAVVSAPEVRIVSFTGSSGAGQHIGMSAARYMKRAHLELGGNNAILVLPGADIEKASRAGAFGSFLHQGQVCQSAGRHLVHESQAEEYVARLAEVARNLRVGDPFSDPSTQIGPLIDAGQVDRVTALINDAVTSNATLVTGGAVDDRFLRPTVLAGVTAQMRVWNEEIFGPVAPVRTYRTIDEAIDIINDSEFGLVVSVLGDAGSAMEVVDRVTCGIVHVNEQTVGDEAMAPFGGSGSSGNGARFGGPEANIEAFTETQWVTVRAKIDDYDLS